MIEAYITNLDIYNGGDLCGEYLKLPATKEDVQTLLSRIGVDGVLHEEIFITDYKMGIASLHGCLGEYESIDELNYLASLLDDMDEGDVEKFEAAIAYGEHTNGADELINLAQNLDCYDFYSGVENEEDLGRFYIDEMSALEVPEHLEYYFDYEAYGQDMSLEDGGRFVGDGYVLDNGNSFIEHYGDRDDIPDEYKIFAYPDPPRKMSIKQQLEMYGSMVTAHAADRPAPERAER